MLFTPLKNLLNWKCQMMNKAIVNLLLFLSLNLIPAFAQNKTGFFSVENRLHFGDYLFCSGDYIRAIDEYNFVLNERDDDSLKFKIALAYQKLDRFNDAEKYFGMFRKNSPLLNEANFEYYRSIYLSGFFTRLRGEFYLSSFKNSDYDNDIQKLANLTKLYSNSEIDDSVSFFEPFNDNESVQLLKFYLRKKNLESKSPTLAAVMSAIIPGLGKIYTENYGDGITAFLITGVLTFLSIDNFNADHDFRGWLFAGLAAYFYAGNIYGSAASAQIYNANVRITFDSDLKFFLNKNNHFVPKSNWFCE